MSVRNFENSRWKGTDQVLSYRHNVAVSMIDKGNVLDLGAGDGLLLSLLKDKGISGIGLDISEEGILKARAKGLNVSVHDFNNRLTYKDGSFDVVTMLDLLEHLYSPEELLKEAIRVSKKSVIISVPNFNSLPARIQVLMGKIPENNRSNKGHLYWFNYRVLSSMLKSGGLKIVSLKSNTFFERIPVIGSINKILAWIFPNMFALSFVVKADKIK